MSKEFIRENRYLVLKRKDIETFLSIHKQRQLFDLAEQVDDGRFSVGKPKLSTVVVEEDWPEFNQIWNSIENRVTGNITSFAATQAQAGAWLEVCSTLDEVSPGWTSAIGSGTECAKKAIHKLAVSATSNTTPMIGNVPKPQKCCNFWRNDAIDSAANIAKRYRLDHVAEDISNMKRPDKLNNDIIDYKAQVTLLKNLLKETLVLVQTSNVNTGAAIQNINLTLSGMRD